MAPNPQKGADALAKFAKAIENPRKRKQYADDEISLGDLIGQDLADGLKPSVKDFLDARTDTELQLLSQMEQTLQDAGISERRNTGTLAKF